MLNKPYILKTIDDISIEDRIKKNFTISEKMIFTFAELTEDHNPLHTDINFGKKTFFKNINAQGQLLSALLIGIVGSSLPGPGWFCLGVDAQFQSPVFIDDELSLSVEVIQKIPAMSVVVLKGEIFNNTTGKVALTSQIKTKSLEL